MKEYKYLLRPLRHLHFACTPSRIEELLVHNIFSLYKKFFHVSKGTCKIITRGHTNLILPPRSNHHKLTTETGITFYFNQIRNVE